MNAPAIQSYYAKKTRGLIDWRTLPILLSQVMGFPLLIWAVGNGFSYWLAIPISIFLMNLSFTAWHEPCHGNFSSRAWINTLTGVVVSFFSVYPGYFARRREHLIHHRYEGEEGRDPVYPRIQVAPWAFPFFLLKIAIKPPSLDIPDGFYDLTLAQRCSDFCSDLLALSVFIAAWLTGWGPVLTLVWILPRVVIFWLHGYLVCFFPHYVNGGGYREFRVWDRSWIGRWISVGQNYHGIHHLWPAIPWHAYGLVFREQHVLLEKRGMEFKPD